MNLGPKVNSSVVDNTPFVSRDGLTLYFYSARQGNADLYVTHRESQAADWEWPQNLGSIINSTDSEYWPTLSPDGHRLYFSVFRAGNYDLYVSRRRDRNDDFGWDPPVPVAELNTAYNDVALVLFEDEATGDLMAYFTSNRRAGSDGDLYVTRLQEDGTFAPAEPLSDLNTNANTERLSTVRRDGLEVFFNRGSGTTTGPIWRASRESQADAWSALMQVPAPVNTSGNLNMSPRLSFDGTQLYFASDRTGSYGGLDLYVSTRSKSKIP